MKIFQLKKKKNNSEVVLRAIARLRNHESVKSKNAYFYQRVTL